MLVHHWVTPALTLLIPIYTPGWHFESKVSCPRTQQARTPTPVTQSGVKLTNVKTTSSPLVVSVFMLHVYPKSIFYSFNPDLESVLIFPEFLFGSMAQGDLVIWKELQ